MAIPSIEQQEGGQCLSDQFTTPGLGANAGAQGEAKGATGAKATRSEFRPGKQFLLAFVSLNIIAFAAALDATSLSIALPTITERLHGSAIEAFWSGTSFLIASAVVQPVVCALSDAFGRKALTLVSALFFGLGSLLAALAHSFTTMIVGRSIQGLGGGGIVVLTEIIVTDMVPLADRGAWIAWISLTMAIGTILGPLLGGGFTQASYSSWRWIFWINLPITGTGAVAIAFFLSLKRPPGNKLSKLKIYDWFGSAIFIASAVSFLVPVTWGGVMYSWSSWHTLLPMFLGLAGLVVFGAYEWWLSTKAFDSDGNPKASHHVQPIIRTSVFRNWTLRVLFLQTMVHGMLLWSLLYFLPLYYQAVKGYSPFLSSICSLPETVFIGPMAVLVGYVAATYGRYRWAIWSGWTIATLGFGILYLLDADTSIAAFIFLNIPVAIGTGLCFTSMLLGISAAGRPRDAGYCVTFYSFVRVLGQALGVAIGGAVFQNQIRRQTAKYPLLAPYAEQFTQDATAVVTLIKSMDAGPKKTQLVQAYADSLKIIWVVMASLSGAMLVASCFVKHYTLVQNHESLQGLDRGDEDKSTNDVALRAGQLVVGTRPS